MTGCCGGIPAYGAGPRVIADEKRGFSALGTAMKRFSNSVVLVADNDGVSKQPADCLLAQGATMRTCTTKWPPRVSPSSTVLPNWQRLAGSVF